MRRQPQTIAKGGPKHEKAFLCIQQNVKPTISSTLGQNDIQHYIKNTSKICLVTMG